MDPTDSAWTTVRIAAMDDLIDLLSDFLHEAGSGGTVIEESSSDESCVVAYFPTEFWQEIAGDLTAYIERLSGEFPHLPVPSVTLETLRVENWAVMWRDRFRPTAIGERLMVTPPWIEPVAEGRVVVVIDPAAAFGTGTHETTRCCLILVERAVGLFASSSKKPSFLDVGCGSGVLALAAAKLGLTDITAIDNDPVAIESALRNASLTGVREAIRWECTALEELDGTWDIVVANLDSPTLIDNAKRLYALTGSLLIVSGVPTDQWNAVEDALLSSGFRLETPLSEGEWTSALLSRSRSF